MFEDIPVEVGVVHEGERIRRKDMYLELGGPDVKEKFELVRVLTPDKIEDGKIQVIGPDLSQMGEGTSNPFGILIEVAGPKLEEAIEGVLERRIHEFSNYLQGVMHLNQRYDIWIRISKRAFAKGLNSFTFVGKVLLTLFKNELPIIEKMQVTFLTDPFRVEEIYREARKIYDERDARARGLTDDEVDTFYGCALCQSFAPSHICVITPQRYANCGAISWFDGRAAASIDPKGPIFPIEKGECLDPVRGEFSGVNESAKNKSLGEINQIYLYSAFGRPHTSCGCFEGIAFYIPEVEGFGIVHRRFPDPTVNGLPFSTMADSTAGGRQVEGFHGISLEYMRSPRFLQADGGYRAVVWMPSEIKERMKENIPADIYDKIATEKDVSTLESLRAFLEEKKHPVVQRWKKELVAEPVPEGGLQVFTAREVPITQGGIRIILKNARITAEKVILQPLRPQKPKKGEGRG
ncbi:MAG: CO dehydrogenase/CO-methylating acetyl-CoA synthase complex subunit beta [Methanomicrobiales archaeon]|nr:CO dehydrogenase/CO-methylating acetyl-CoA synthase complex subunit beta [Methanomicrobiales archaeon]